MGELNLGEVLKRLDSGLVRDRPGALADLKQILSYNQRNPTVSTIDDASFHMIFDVLFSVVTAERSAYFKTLGASKTQGPRTMASNKLSFAASALRLAVELGVHNLKFKTVRALLDHLTETLLGPEGFLCGPLALDYAKCLTIILAHAAHVEHLPGEDWTRACMFFLDRVRDAGIDREVDSIVCADAGLPQASNGSDPKAARNARLSAQASLAGDASRDLPIEEFIVCLRHVTSAPAAPLLAQARAIYATLVPYLSSIPTSVRSIHFDALTVINNALRQSRLDDTVLTRKCISRLLNLVRGMWSTKAPAVRDELLITLVLIMPYISQCARELGLAWQCDEKDPLLDTMQTEYSRRAEREQLQLDDIILQFASRPSADRLSSMAFALRENNARAEHNWSTLVLMAELFTMSTGVAIPRAGEDAGNDVSASRKRVRQAHWCDELVRLALHPEPSSKIYALQVIAFVVQKQPIEEEVMERLSESLLRLTNDSSPLVVSWAFVALARYARSPPFLWAVRHSDNSSLSTAAAASSPNLTKHWLASWQVACRAVNNPLTCRAACHLSFMLLHLDLVARHDSFENVASIGSSIDVNGPSLVCDSSCALLRTIIIRNVMDRNPDACRTSERVLSWLFHNWAPSNLDDRLHMAHQARIRPNDILDLLYACISQAKDDPLVNLHPVWGRLGQAWKDQEDGGDLLRYLLLEPSTEKRSVCSASVTEDHAQISRPSTTSNLLVLCTGELNKALEQWKQLLDQRASNISQDRVASLCTLVCVVQCLANCLQTLDRHRLHAMSTVNSNLFDHLLKYLASADCEEEKVDTALSIVVGQQPRWLLTTLRDSTITHTTALVVRLSIAVNDRSLRPRVDPLDFEYDPMDLDSEGELQQQGHSVRRAKDHLYPRRDLPALYGVPSRRAGALLYANIVRCLTLVDPDPEPVGGASAAIVEHVLSLPIQEIIAARSVLAALPEYGLHLSPKDLFRLLDRLSAKILTSYEHERCEVAHLLMLDVLFGHAGTWTDRSDRKLYDLGVDIYDWFANKALPKKTLSSHAVRRLAALLLELISRAPDFGQEEDMPSVRTVLFQVLRGGDLTAKQFIAERIHTIFNLFTLSAHDAVFEDLQESLPKDSDWKEGIAMRVQFFARLGSQWPSLLRRAIYHIFEIAVEVPASASYAARGVLQISKSLSFDSPRALFVLFSSQLLHTFLAGHDLSGLPFSVFSYDDLAGLLRENQVEIYAQLLLNGKDNDLDHMTHSLGAEKSDLIRLSFSKALAYAFSQDISSAQSGSSSANEARIRDLFATKEEYVALVNLKAPEIVAQVWISMQQDGSAERAMEKSKDYRYASQTLEKIKAFGASSKALPANLQPSFRGKFLPGQLDRICRRADIDLKSLFNTSRVTVILNKVLDTLHKALDPLKACQIIHKLRILVSLAGNSVLEGYPVEMLLKTLRPFLCDAQCADDTLGLLQYLFESGKKFLAEQMPRLTGLIFLTLLSMKSFMQTKQDSTTQESQFRTTVSKMQAFHDWLTAYLVAMADKVQERARTRFHSLVHACRDLTLPAIVAKDHPAGELFVGLLDDIEIVDPRQAVLEGSYRQEVLAYLCKNFTASESRNDDLFADDAQSTKYASRVWALANSTSLEGEYASWVAKTLGRAHCSSGLVSLVPSIHRYTDDRSGSLAARGTSTGSRAVLATRIMALLTCGNRHYVGLAENTIRMILARFEDPAECLEFEQHLSPQLVTALGSTPRSGGDTIHNAKLDSTARKEALQKASMVRKQVPFHIWVRQLAVATCAWSSNDPIVGSLGPLLQEVEGLAVDIFPVLVHLALNCEFDQDRVLHATLSQVCSRSFREHHEFDSQVCRLLLQTVLYLLAQPVPNERVRTERQQWLNIDLLAAAETAARCEMPTTALFLLESQIGQAALPSAGRRSSASPATASQPSDELLLTIFRSVDDPDSFYGVDQPSTLASVRDKLDFEGNGMRALMLHAAQADASMRNASATETVDSAGIFKSLGILNLHSLTHLLLNNRQGPATDLAMSSIMLDTARRLDQWDLPAGQVNSTSEATLYSVLQSFNVAGGIDEMLPKLNSALQSTVRGLQDPSAASQAIRTSLLTLSVLTELDEVVNAQTATGLAHVWERMQRRQHRWDIGRSNEVQQLASFRETMFSSLCRNKVLRDFIHVSARDSRLLEARVVVNNARLASKHDSMQQSLTEATYLSSMVPVCEQLGLKIDLVADFEAANVLWKQGEIATSVKILETLCGREDTGTQSIKVGLAGMLAQLGHQVASARLQKPEDVILNYLKPAIQELRQSVSGSEAGQVYYEFATFCDQQLQNPDSQEDFVRLGKLRESKHEEWQQLIALYASTPSSQKVAKQNVDASRRKAKTWYDLDNLEYQKAKKSRDDFVQQSLQNYLLTLQACNDHDQSVVRFFALWLEYADSEAANQAVQQHIDRVPSWKFVVLMNQQMSRLLREDTIFQTSLDKLITRICTDHPHHSAHHIFASCKTAVGTTDEVGSSRHAAASAIAVNLRGNGQVGALFQKVWEANELYHRLAAFRVDSSKKSRFTLKSMPVAYQMSKRVVELQVPPATLDLELRPSANYQRVPVISSFQEEIKIASGISAPKILTARATNGRRYRQLFKGGNDDLRQDAIMEQVFGEVSKMLRNHKVTRQRNLHVRTYKVLPLSSTSGIIEFVPDSIPLHDVVVPSHEKYHPNDLKWSAAREKIRAAQPLAKEARASVFRTVTAKYAPVLRQFFFERFEDPDDWFEKRLAYTRSTATISILGHVLGLGDRHCHNILLDEKSGEAIHIDLGVAFEAGRVLPIPEVVPFRLTRDIVDGMGITKTEGVFRRCCEFTMDALREDKDSIMTLLNVLRYDPLYSWTVSPLRAKRMQEAQATELGNMERGSKVQVNEAAEAERALAIVERKLSKTLSTAATINELIQQATDERNLALLFAGMSASARRAG